MRSDRPQKSMGYMLLPILLFAVPLIANTQAGWTPELEMRVKGVSAVRVSPDGKKVAYTVSSAVMTPEKSEFVAQIWVANSDGTEAVQLTYAEKSSDNPQWSPDGKMLAFTSSRSGKSNLYVLSFSWRRSRTTYRREKQSQQLCLGARWKFHCVCHARSSQRR